MLFKNKLEKISKITTEVKRTHGGKNSLLSINTSAILDFSVSINPYFSSISKLISFKKIKINEYPDPACSELKHVLAKHNSLSDSNCFIANGSAEIIMLLFFCFVKNDDTIMALWPSYGDYKYYTNVMRSRFIPIYVTLPNFSLNINDIIDNAKLHNPKLFFFCNPTNPTGKYYTEKEVLSILDNLPKTTIFILDEAYINFAYYKWDSTKFIKKYPNLIILRSLTKDYALTSLRLGYSLSSKEIVNYLETAAPSWHVNGYAQTAGIQILKYTGLLKESVLKIEEEKTKITEQLMKLGYEVIPSDINSLLLKVRDSQKIVEWLLAKNIFVRDCTSYDLPNYVRISIRRRSDNNKLILALRLFKQNYY